MKIKTFLIIGLLGSMMISTLGAQDKGRFKASDSIDFQSQVLDGEWAFYWKKFTDSVIPQSNGKPDHYLRFAAPWSSFPYNQVRAQAHGYSTYVLYLNADKAASRGLYIPRIRSSYRLYLNGHRLAQSGQPAKTASEERARQLPQAVKLPLERGRNVLVFHISNFSHAEGGAMEAPELGDYDYLAGWLEFYRGSQIFLAGGLLFLGLLAAAFFTFHYAGVRYRDWSVFYFTLFALSYAFYMLAAPPYALSDIFSGLTWHLSYRMEMIALIFSGLALTFSYRHFVRPMAARWIFRGMVVMGAIMLAGLFLPSSTFTVFSGYYPLIMLAYAMVIIAVYLRHLRGGKSIVWISSAAVLSIMAVTFVNAAAELGWWSPIYWLTGLLHVIFFLSQSSVVVYCCNYTMKKSLGQNKESQVSQRNFLNSVSHELRTPMNAILGITDELRGSDLGKEPKKKLDTIFEKGQNLNELLQDLLNFSALDSGEMKPDYRKMELAPLMEKVLEKVRGNHPSKSIEVATSFDPNIPEEVVGDPEMIEKILTHLLDNAFKFTEKGKIKFSVTTLERDNLSTRLHFRVSDTGKGISKAELDRVLEAFYQGDQGNTRTHGGTGLGLTISASLVELMGGDLWIESKPGKGTIIEFDLSMRIPQSNLSDAIQDQKEKNFNLDPGLKILYAEDNPINQKLLVMMMKSMGYEIDTAADGKEAWKMAMKNNYDIIFMDIQMPEMDGIEATRHIIRDIKERPIIIAVTANADVADQQRCMEAGMNDFIGKPFNAKTLKEGLARWQSLRRYLNTRNNEFYDETV